MAFARVSPVVKAVDSTLALEVAPPTAIRVFRHYFETQDFTIPRTAVEAILAALGGYRHPNLVVELYNEIGKGDRDRYVWFCLTAVPLLHQAGLLVAGPGFGTGDYEQADWDAFRAVGFDDWSIHCYWDPGKMDQWEAYRYRTYWRPGDKPILITECGRRMGHHDLDELVTYASETAKDGCIAGVTPFSSGPPDDWAPFSVDSLTSDLIKKLGYGDAPMPAPITVGPGFQKAIPVIGEFLESEIYHDQGKPTQTSLALAKNGYAVYRTSTNEVIAYRLDGAIFADGGNHGDGSLRQIRAPFP